MYRRLRYLWAFLLAAAAAVLLRRLYVTWPCPATAVLSPINESPWELSKLVYWPSLCGSLLLWRQERAQTAPPGGYCAAVLSAAMLMLLLCRFLQAVLPLYVLFLIAVAGAMALHYFVLRRRLPGSGLLWYLLAVILGVTYLLLTALPPGFGIFLPPGNIPAMIPF